MKKRVLYIPTFYYLSHPCFFAISKCVDNKFQNIYFNMKEKMYAGVNASGIKQEEIDEYFDESYDIDYQIIEHGGKYKRFMKFVWNFGTFRTKLENQLNMINPDAIITSADLGEYQRRVCNDWAEKNDVPFIIIQPALFSTIKFKYTLKERLYYLLFNKVLNIPLARRQPFFGKERAKNHLFLWGKYFKESYDGWGIEEHKHIVGCPTFNLIDKSNADDLGFGIPQEKPTVLICSEPFNQFDITINIELNEIYKRTIQENPDLFFVIKLHPRENIDDGSIMIYNDMDCDNYMIIEKTNLQELLKVADVQTSSMSSTSFTSMVYGMPVVQIDMHDKIDYFNITEEIALMAKTSKELGEQLRRCLTEEYRKEFKMKRKKFLEQKLAYFGETSSEKIVETTEKIIHRGETNK